MPLATFGDAKVPTAVPVAVEVSEPNKPVTIGVPEITSAVVDVYTLLFATKPLMVTGAGVMLAVAVIAPLAML